jgi:predicted transcriptional regulator
MEAIQVLCTKILLEGKGAFAWSFSAKSIAHDQNMTVYKARQHMKALREYGLIHRTGNVYMFTMSGYNIAHDVINASRQVAKNGN